MRFLNLFLPLRRTLERVSQNFAVFELGKLRKMCSEIFVQEQNWNIKGGREKLMKKISKKTFWV
jgi:hypothetical protein